MMHSRVWTAAAGLWNLRRPPDIDALRAARSARELGHVSLIPAARNLGIAINLLPRELRSEATAALLACRVLDAYEDLSEPNDARAAVLLAAGYLSGSTDTPPARLRTVTCRDSEAVDLVLADRIGDVRALIGQLSDAAQVRVGQLLNDVSAAMASHLTTPMSRVAYGEGVLGRVVVYACSMISEGLNAAEIAELAGCVGATAQLSNDLRDNEFMLYQVGSRDELTRSIMLRMLAPALGSFALLARMRGHTPSRGARAAMAYVAITTAAFLCESVEAPASYSRRTRLGVALLAASNPSLWDAMLERLRYSVDTAIGRLFDAAPDGTYNPEKSDTAALVFAGTNVRSGEILMEPLIIESTFALVHSLPEALLSGELPEWQIRQMMIADHLAFGALERLRPNDYRGMHELGTRLQLAALDPSPSGVLR